MTDRLYYADSYLTEFDAQVLEVQGNRVRLDRSAFYPTSGGQPFDTGYLGEARVTDVESVAGEVWHTVEGTLREGERVHGRIDWPRRFDHMQQHAGEHMIANAVYRFFDGFTIGLHIGAEVSTIDVELPDGRMRLSPEDIARVEDDVNAHIQQNLPIHCYFPEDVDALPLRKRGDVKENVRVVDIGGYELVPCGGTHPARTGDIGLVKIVDARPSRGKMRLAFLCGNRAVRDYRRRYAITEELALGLSTSVDRLPELVRQMGEHLKEAEYALKQANAQRLLDAADALPAEEAKGYRIVAAAVEGDMEALRSLAARLLERADYALLESSGGNLLFARAQSAPGRMDRLLRQVGKGGGKPDFAQGAAQESGAAQRAAQMLKEELAAGA